MSGSNALTIPRDPTVLVNPLAAIDAGTKSAGLVYDLRQQQANEAAGQAYQGAINQQTGEFDPNEFRRRLAASGPAAMAAGHELANTQNISSDQLKQALEKNKWINSTAGALLQAGDFSDAAMLGALHNGVAGHILTLPEAQAQLQTMPPDAAGRQRWLQVHQDTSASFQEQMNQRFGTPFREDVGGAIVGGVQNQRGGGGLSTGVGALPMGLSPERLSTQVTYNDPATNQPKTTTLEEFLRANRIPIPGAGGTSGGSGAGVGGGGPSGPSPNAAASTGPRGGPTGPNPDMVAKWDASTKQYTADNAEAGNYQQRIFPLAQAAALLQRGNVTTGEGAEAINRAKSFLQTRLATFGLDAQTVSNSEGQELGKYMTQYVNQQGFSQKSDAALASALSGNPSMHLNTMTNKDVIAAMAGMERMKQMMITDFKAQGGEGRTRDWGDFKAKWQNEHDPRAFVVDFLDGPRRQKLIDSMTPEQRRSFDKTLTLVEQNPGVMGLAAMPGH